MRAIKQRKNKKTLIVLAISAAVIVVGAVIAYVLVARPFNRQEVPTITDRPANTIDYSPPSQSEQQAQDQTKNNVVKNDTSPPPANPTPTSAISANFVRADQTGVGQPLSIRVDVAGATTGTCHFTLTRAGQPTVSKDFSIAFEATSSYCSNADIAASAFSESGDWQLKIVVSSGSQESNAITHAVTVAK